MNRVDSRQPPELRGPFLRAGWVSCQLEVGDYEFPEVGGELVLIEDKTVVKFLADMQDGVLLRQCRGLVETARFPILLIRGSWRHINGHLEANPAFTWKQAWNMLETLQDLGCRLQLVADEGQAVTRIFELQEYYAQGIRDSLTRSPSQALPLSALSLVPGIGLAKGKALLQAHHTLATLGQLSEEELRVPGIGPHLAKRVWHFLHDPLK